MDGLVEFLFGQLKEDDTHYIQQQLLFEEGSYLDRDLGDTTVTEEESKSSEVPDFSSHQQPQKESKYHRKLGKKCKTTPPNEESTLKESKEAADEDDVEMITDP